MSPTFTTGTTSYTASIANAVSSVTVTPVVSQANASVKVNGTTTTSGSASAALSMNSGSNIVTVLVTAQDGSTQDTYTITVTRNPYSLVGSPFGGGAGTLGSPYLICTATQLAQLGSGGALNAYYQLQGNIDLTSSGLAPLASSGSPFTGTFDGNNYTLSNLTYSSSGTDYVGLFAATGASATIKDLTLSNFNITGNSNVGALVGSATTSTIQNCKATSASITGYGSNLGGLLGSMSSGTTVTHSSSTGFVKYPNGSVWSCAGGLVGYAIGGGNTITTSYTSADVSPVIIDGGKSNQGGFWFAGGLLGAADGGTTTITDCYAQNNVTARCFIGGIAGGNNGAFVINNSYYAGIINNVSGYSWGLSTSFSGATGTNNYWDSSILQGDGSGYWNNGGPGSQPGTGFATATLKNTQSTYSGWDFTNTWQWNAGSYPILR